MTPCSYGTCQAVPTNEAPANNRTHSVPAMSDEREKWEEWEKEMERCTHDRPQRKKRKKMRRRITFQGNASKALVLMCVESKIMRESCRWVAMHARGTPSCLSRLILPTKYIQSVLLLQIIILTVISPRIQVPESGGLFYSPAAVRLPRLLDTCLSKQ